jgi:hypothetical protein
MKKSKTVAQQVPLLYAYSVLNIVLYVVNLITTGHARQQIIQSLHANTTIANDVSYMIFALMIAAEMYLVFSKDIDRVRLILKVFLSLQVLVTLSTIFNRYLASTIIAVIELGFTSSILRLLKE